MSKHIELRRHTDNDGDALSDEGIEHALAIGRSLGGGYALLVSTGAQRATQTLACFASVLGDPVPGGVVIEPDLRSAHEDRWYQAYQRAGSGELEAMRAADPEFVDADSASLAGGLRRILDRLEEGERALAVGHSPTNEAAVLGLTGEMVDPISKGAGVLLSADGDAVAVEVL